MKYNTFRIIRTIVIIIIAIAVIILLSQLLCKKKASRNLEVNNLQSNTQVQPSPKIKYGADVLPLTADEKEIIQYQKSAITGSDVEKKGDSYVKVINTNKYRIELRCDTKKGFDFWNRLKIDYNKNKNWDEKWTISKEGNIKREVSPDDNENYTYIYNLKGEHWLKK